MSGGIVVTQLWDGADVRWAGPVRSRGGVRLQPGDRAVVVDAGRYHIGSFTTLYREAGHPQPRPGRGVVIRLADGAEVRVPARQLELVAPDHPLRPEPDGRVADWWLSDLDRWGRPTLPVAAFVPRNLPAVCRLLHPWTNRADDPVPWDDVTRTADVADRAELARRLVGAQYGMGTPPVTDGFVEPTEGVLDPFTATTLVELLGGATTTPQDVFFAVWKGWGDTPPARFPGAATIDTPARGHFLLRGPIEGALTSVAASPVGPDPVSGIWWPADRAWLLHTEIDFHWTFIGGAASLVETLVAHDDLEAEAIAHDAEANRLAPDASD